MESRPAGIKRGLLGSSDTDLLNRKKENVSSEHLAINKKTTLFWSRLKAYWSLHINARK